MLSSLVSEWTFDNPANIGEDTWGSNHCSLVVPAGLSNPEIRTDDCISNTCLYFENDIGLNEAGSYLNCGSLSTPIKIWTIELWIKTSQTGKMPFTIGNVSIYGNSGIAWGGNTWYPGIGDVCNNKWHHLVFTYSETNHINGNNVFAYVDGKLVAEGNKNWPPVKSPIFIGCGYGWGKPNGSTYPYKGLIDEIRIYDNHMSISQIKQNYIAGLDSMLRKGTLSKHEYNERLEALANVDF
ncbi:MAG: LamG domain-containing protein [Candidatus Paceibacterota bacterium]